MYTFEEKFAKSEHELEQLYFEFLRYPSISADPAYRPQLKACASWVEQFLIKNGFDVELWNKDDAPIIFASNCKAGPSKPTVLIYNHYDVQPVDPLELWTKDPFEPRREGDLVIARGAQDNKGQCFYVLAALKALLKEDGTLPVNIKLCIEGEEESGSSALAKVLKTKKDVLKADYLMIVDVSMKDEKTPAITLGTRGMCSFTVEARGSNTDLHSGVYGGVVYNPLHALVEILSSLRDSRGQITIPGFYDAMILPTAEELSCISFDFNEEGFEKDFGAMPTGGEKSFSPLQRSWLRPTLEINGVTGGYGGPGTKTVIAARAQAKLSCRLVPNQDPAQITQLVKNYIESLAPKGVDVTCTIHEGIGKPVRTSPSSKLVQALSAACGKVYHRPAEYIYDGASIPIVAELQEACQSDVVFFGLGLATDKIHAPNECFGWDRIKNGFLILCEALSNL